MTTAHKSKEIQEKAPILNEILEDVELGEKGRAIVRVNAVLASPTEGLSFRHFEARQTVRLANFPISDDEMAEHVGSEVVVHPCRAERQR